MTKRLLAFVAALAVVSAPVALEVCRITCDSKVMKPSVSDADGQATHHHVPAEDASCHEHHSAGPQLSPSGIPCDHGVQGTPSLVAAKASDTALSSSAVVPVTYSFASDETGDTRSLCGSASGDRLAVPLAIPLRV